MSEALLLKGCCVSSSRVSRGFTLIELLIAMVVFAVLAVMAYSGLRAVIKTGEGVERQIEQLESLQRAMLVIESDLRQMMPRAVNTDLGKRESAFLLDDSGAEVMRFTRGGRQNPASLLRSSLQRVHYIIEDGVLVRKSWGYADNSGVLEPSTMRLLEKVTDVNVRFLDAEFKWQTSQRNQNNSNLNQLPLAVEITIQHELFEDIRRLIPVAGY